MGMLHHEQLQLVGFKHVGRDVRVSDKASFYGAARISIGDGSRIDDFCVLSAGEGGIEIGRWVHLAVSCSLIGRGRIHLADFCNLSSRVSIYSSNDDYSGATMTNPCVPAAYTGVTHGPVTLERHVIVGAGSVVLPNVTLAQGAAVGALALVTRDCQAFTIYGGVPAAALKERRRDLLELERRFLAERAATGA